MLIVTKKPIKIQKEVIGIEEKKIAIKFENPVFIGEDGATVLFTVFDDKVQNDQRTGRPTVIPRAKLVLKIEKDKFSQIINGEKTKFEIYIPKITEIFKEINTDISISDFEEKE